MSEQFHYIEALSDLGIGDVPSVGGKNASLGEMIGNMKESGIAVPDGFAINVNAYWAMVHYSELTEAIADIADQVGDDLSGLSCAGKSIRALMESAPIPPEVEQEIRAAYFELCAEAGGDDVPVAVRSSATAEDLPDASFAGQQATYLNVTGIDDVLSACRSCYASLFNDRAIAYRIEKGFGQDDVALSIGIQRMARSDRGASGVAFSIDTETGHPDIVVINAAYGLGETVVQGSVDPDEFMVFKPLLGRDRKPIIEKRLGSKLEKMILVDKDGVSHPEIVSTDTEERKHFCIDDAQALQLAEWVKKIEYHYDRPMDVEWALDGETGELFIVQARPETVQSQREDATLERVVVGDHGDVLAEGVAIGDGAATGKVRRLESPADGDQLQPGEILYTGMTDPDWLPVMRKASAIVTERGGRTSHAAIVSRELGVPAVTGVGEHSNSIEDGEEVTVACCEGSTGRVYDGIAEIERDDVDLTSLPKTNTKVMLNLADPSSALSWWRLPADGVGLARMEFIIANQIKIHPLALTGFDDLPDDEVKAEIERMTVGYADKREYFIARLAQGISRIAAALWPKPVLLRTSDFKSNEYADLIGGEGFEPDEENPMLGWRGVSRYIHPDFEEGFALECEAIRRVREDMGFTNLNIMLPFCRTVDEAKTICDVMAERGIVRGRDGLEIYAMCEVPSNVLLVNEFGSLFDGFSIGSNDLTQLILGVERDSSRLQNLFDEMNPAVQTAIASVIAGGHASDCKVGLCGQGPSDNPEFARFLVSEGIDSISVTPDSFAKIKENVAVAERERAVPMAAAAE